MGAIQQTGKRKNTNFNLKTTTRQHQFYKTFVVACGGFLLAYLAASIFMPVKSSDASEVTVSNRATGYYVTVSSADAVGLNIDSTPSGSIASAKDTINVKTNAPTGYQLYLSASSSNLYNTEDTDHTAIHFEPTSGSISTPVSLSINTWGFALDKSSGSSYSANFADISNYAESGTPSSTSTWAAVPDNSQTLIQEYSNPTTDSGVDTDIYYGANATTRLPSGDYSTTIYYTAVAEGATEIIMQDFTAAECSALSENQVVKMMDIRNNETYNVVKARDGNCWMADNLAISNIDIYPDDSNIPTGTSFHIPESTNWSGDSYTPKLHISTTSGYEGEVYYNWATAVAMEDVSNTTNQVNQSICPKRWRLPINGDATQDKSYTKLLNAYGVSNGTQLLNSSHASYILGFHKYYGNFYHGYNAEYGQGGEGVFWTSTPASTANAYHLLYYSNGGLAIQHDFSKSIGYSVRCVFEGETIQDITYMQDMTKAICDATNTGVTARLRDKRGRGNAGSAEDDSYGVIKAKDGNCWMTENFDLYNMTGNNAIKAADSDFASGTYEIPESSNWGSNIYIEPRVHQATNSGYTDQVYYNWCATTATSNTTNPNCNTTSQVDQSICPKGWQLPVSGNTSTNKSFTKLWNDYGATSGDNLTSPSHASYVLGFTKYYGFGNISNGGSMEYQQGICSAFWSSTPIKTTTAHDPNYYNRALRDQEIEKGFSMSIRCVNRD